MANATPRTEKMNIPPAPEFVTDMWDTAIKAQRQMLGVFTQPLGFMPAPEKMWNRWQVLNKECLEHTEKGFDRMKDFVTDEVKFVRDFSDKAVEMTKVDVDEKAPPTIKPEMARAWFDTSWRCFERSVDFNTKSMKAVEEFGMKVSEMVTKEPLVKV